MVIAVTRQTLESFASSFADSTVVFGKATIARLSQVRTGLALGIAGLGVLPRGGRAPGPPPPGGPFSAPFAAPGPLPSFCCARLYGTAGEAWIETEMRVAQRQLYSRRDMVLQ